MRRMAWQALAAAGAVGLVAACGGLPPGTVPGTVSLTGTARFNGAAPPQPLTIRLRTATGTNLWAATAGTTQTVAGGSFTFNNLGAGRYQPYYDDQGQITTDQGVNTAGVAVPDPVEVTTSGTPPTVTFDVAWPVNPNPAVSSTIALPYTFAWSPKPFLPGGAEYQVFVKGYNASTQLVGTDLWSSDWNTGNSVTWNGRIGTGTNTPTGALVGSGSYVYQVKYRKAGGTYGGGNFFGQTKWIPFTVGS